MANVAGFNLIYGILGNQANFNENPSMRAIVKVLRARASEHLSKFCEQIEQKPNFAREQLKIFMTIRYPFNLKQSFIRSTPYFSH